MGKGPFELDRGYIAKSQILLLHSKLRKMGLHLTSAPLSNMQARASKHAQKCISDDFEYEKKRMDSPHKDSSIQIGNLVLISTVHSNNLNVNAELKTLFICLIHVTGLVEKKNQGKNTWCLKNRTECVLSLLVETIQGFIENLKRADISPNLPTINEVEAVILTLLNKRLVRTGKNELQYLVTFKNKSTYPDT